jgi:hypothetical protein
MSAFTQAHGQNVLNFTFIPASAVSITSPIKIKQMSTTGSESAAGTELSGSGFTAGGVTITWNAPATSTGTYSATIGNQALTITNAPAGTVNGIDIVDSTGTPRRLAWGALTTPRTLVAGDTLSYPANAIVVSI